MTEGQDHMMTMTGNDSQCWALKVLVKTLHALRI